MSQSPSAKQLELERQLKRQLRVRAQARRVFSQCEHQGGNLFEVIAGELTDVLGDHCAVFLLASNRDDLIPSAVCSHDAEIARSARLLVAQVPYRLSRHETSRRVVLTGIPFFRPEFDVETLRSHTSGEYVDFCKSIGVHSCILVGLGVGEGCFGTLNLMRYREESRAFTEADVELAEDIALEATKALEARAAPFCAHKTQA